MMLAMKTEMKARDERQPDREIVAARVMPVGKRLGGRLVGKVCAKREQLQRGEDPGQSPEQRDVFRRDQEYELVDT